ncbi:leucyl/phenylalanyl-tRNA--protein transferase [Thalassolituus sp. LLYu03]|uniref:leucyl/phenylalanyl-tRNA--protein transferase n=1 Tax=Thalassolituus sp. LLYu03 TaxID=3421656 RepID=UPI003D295A59
MIDWLDETSLPRFPSTGKALSDPNGLLAAGGVVSPLWIDAAYRSGIFPWNDPDEVRLWWSPAPRAVIRPQDFRIPRSVKKAMNRSNFTVTTNLAFESVMHACAQPRDYEAGTWISDDIVETYTRLNACGRAVSVECWDGSGMLCGGFYGLTIGAAFFGESMFSRVSDASKIAFATAAPYLFDSGIEMIDCQMKTDHLGRFGLVELDRGEFEALLAKNAAKTSQLNLPGVLR